MGSGMSSLTFLLLQAGPPRDGLVALMPINTIVQKGHSVPIHGGAERGLSPRVPIRQYRKFVSDAVRDPRIQ